MAPVLRSVKTMVQQLLIVEGVAMRVLETSSKASSNAHPRAKASGLHEGIH